MLHVVANCLHNSVHLVHYMVLLNSILSICFRKKSVFVVYGYVPYLSFYTTCIELIKIECVHVHVASCVHMTYM